MLVMKVDVRLCGAIPRSEWTRHPDNCQTDCDARLTSSCLAATNALANAPTAIGSKSDGTIGGCRRDAHHSLLLSLPSCTQIPSHDDDNKNNSTSIPASTTTTTTLPSSTQLDTTALMPLLDPPSWAVPATGEARLEVSIHVMNSTRSGSNSTLAMFGSCSFLFRFRS